MSVGIESFLSESVTDIKIFSDVLTILKSALKNVESTVQSWSTCIYFEIPCEPMSVAEFVAMQRKVECYLCDHLFDFICF